MATSSRSLDLDIVTLRRIYIRNPTSNALIQSNYALLSDGNGGTFWSTVVTGSNGSSGISGAQLSSFSTSIGTSFTSQLITTQTLVTSNLTVSSSNINIANFNITQTTASNLRIPSLACCNIFIDQGWTLASSYRKLVSSNLNYYLSNDDMGAYIFCQSPSNLNFIPPGVTPTSGYTNPFSGQSQGNFFTLKNLGSNILNVVTNPTTAYPVITSTTATFFYVGTPLNFWTPM